MQARRYSNEFDVLDGIGNRAQRTKRHHCRDPFLKFAVLYLRFVAVSMGIL